MKVKVESEKVGLKLNIQKIKIMASGPITSWPVEGEAMEAMRDFILGVGGGAPRVQPPRHSEEKPGVKQHKFLHLLKALLSTHMKWTKSFKCTFVYKSLQMVIAAMKLKDAYSLEEKLWPT